MLDGQTIHIHDILAQIETEYPDARVPQQLTGTRTALNVPLMREGLAIGAIGIRRTEVRPFTEKHIKLLETFAAQAVIAIENVRLFKELGSAMPNCARRWNIRLQRVRNAGHHQSAHRMIFSQSSTPSSRALQRFVESMTWCCDYRKDGSLVSRAHIGPIPIRREEVSIDTATVSLDAGARHPPRS